MYDYLIIGQGIAGSVLAFKLIEAGQSVMILDHRSAQRSSIVAAGMMNPITGKRFVLSWKAHELFPTLKNTYELMEREAEASFYHPVPVVRIIPDISTSNDWSVKISEELYSGFISDDHKMDDPHQSIDQREGIIKIKGGGYLDTEVFLDKMRSYFISKKSYKEVDQMVSPQTEGEAYFYGNMKFKKVVWCNGIEGMNESPFSYLPFTPMKGEVLTIRSQKLPQDYLIIGACFLSPIGDHKFRVGATYNWRNLDLNISSEAREELEMKLQKITKSEYEVIDHKVGIRPAVKDRKPLIGAHPTLPNCYLFNGFGSKAVTLSPWLAEHFIQHLSEGTALLPEIDLNRYQDAITA